jgi:hypothetical protein
MLSLEPRQAPPPLWLIFVDSLSDRVAFDPGMMPNLARMREKGAQFTVEACRDRLTYRCLHAALSGEDASSWLTLRANFDHRPQQGGTLLHLASRRGRVVALGAHDLEAYGDAYGAAWYFPSPETPEAQLLDRLPSFAGADLVVIGLSQGDRAAHAAGPGSPLYREAFREIDRILGELAARAPPGAHLVIFGDHGHDQAGHHLPGGEATTAALYLGPAVRAGVSGKLQITDHRILLGVLLGLPTPALYRGPPLEDLLEPSWLREHLGALPELRGQPRAALGLSGRLALAAVLSLALLLACWGAGRAFFPRRPWVAFLAAAGLVVLRLLGGLLYEPLCLRIHDHGEAPWRAAFLLLPLGGGLLAGRWLLGHWRGGASLAVLVPLLLLFPSANYYGSGRAIVHGSWLALALAAPWLLRRSSSPLLGAVCLALAPLALALFLGVRRVGDVAGDQGFFELSSPLLASHASRILVASRLLGFLLLPRLLSPSASLHLARGLLAAGALSAALDRTLFPPELLLLLPPLLLLGAPARGLALALGWVAMDSIYPAPAAAALGALLAGIAGVLVVLRDARISPEQRGLAGAGVALVTGYLALWPAVGMRLAGLDFSFMFRWIPASHYETFWWLIGLGLAAKVALAIFWPGLLAISSVGGKPWLLPVATLKALSLALFAATWGVVGPLTALPGQEALSELGLVLFASLMIWASGWFVRRGVGFQGTSPVLDCPSSSACATDACS